MLELKSVLRRFLENRRRHPRVRRPYDAELWDGLEKEVFRGKVLDISRGGIHIRGLRSCQGVFYGQRVQIRILISPKVMNETGEVVTAQGRVCRLVERDDYLDVALEFQEALAEDKLP